MRQAELNKKKVGDGHPVYVIAEIGINHGGDLDTAFKLIDAAARSGADAVKFQTYITEKRTPKNSPIFDILKKCELPFGAFEKIKAHASHREVEFFSTPFDEESLECLEAIACPFYKIASFDVTHTGFLEAVASKKKPVILSVGMSNQSEISRAVEILSRNGQDVVLLHCVTAYPMPEKDANLSAIYTLREFFDCVIGQSDHTPDITVPLYAVAAGARVLEKHFMLTRDMACVDAPVSIDESQMGRLVSEVRRLEGILGRPALAMREIEAQYQWLRRV